MLGVLHVYNPTHYHHRILPPISSKYVYTMLEKKNKVREEEVMGLSLSIPSYRELASLARPS